jgi:hypothetical protein
MVLTFEETKEMEILKHNHDMNGECSNSFWIGKMARLEIVKDEHRLSFTKSLILELDETTITFKDKFGEVLAFNRSLIKEMKLI